MFKLTIVILAVCTFATHAAVIRTTDNDTYISETTTASNDIISTTEELDLTTIRVDDLNNNTTTERIGALSRDEEATILIVDQTLLDPAPAELIKTNPETVEIEKSAKLLLLSTPKIAEKPKQPEENLEESDEEENETFENVTEVAVESTTTEDSMNDETTTTLYEDVEQNKLDTKDDNSEKSIIKSEVIQSTETSFVDQPTTVKITKLYPINDTLYADSHDNKMKNFETNESTGTIIVDDQPKEPVNSNLGSVVLEESEADYVLVESEVLEGSYADVDSELHLQPIVQSVEIVPSSLDDQLLINYVQNW